MILSHREVIFTALNGLSLHHQVLLPLSILLWLINRTEKELDNDKKYKDFDYHLFGGSEYSIHRIVFLHQAVSICIDEPPSEPQSIPL